MHIIATILVTFATLLATFVFFPVGFTLNESKLVIVLGYLVLIPITIGYRRTWHLRMGQMRRQRTVVFIGDRASCREFQSEFTKMNSPD